MNGSYRSSAAAGPGTLGIVLALVAIFLAMFLAGAGHGWVMPLVMSLPLILIYPLALIRDRVGRGTGIAPNIALVAIALVADIVLVWSSIDHRAEWTRGPTESVVPGVDRSVFPLFLLWLLLWLHWQFVALRSLIHNARRQPPQSDMANDDD